jgi:hypothetical protein
MTTSAHSAGAKHTGLIGSRLTLNEDFDHCVAQTLGTFKRESLDRAGVATRGLPKMSDAKKTSNPGQAEGGSASTSPGYPSSVIHQTAFARGSFSSSHPCIGSLPASDKSRTPEQQTRG